jgi:hypothetical protein
MAVKPTLGTIPFKDIDKCWQFEQKTVAENLIYFEKGKELSQWPFS